LHLSTNRSNKNRLTNFFTNYNNVWGSDPQTFFNFIELYIFLLVRRPHSPLSEERLSSPSKPRFFLQPVDAWQIVLTSNCLDLLLSGVIR